MLSDDALENLIRPIMQRQEDINNYIVGLIAKRINEIGRVNASDVAKLYNLMNTGGDMLHIQKALANATKMNANEIKSVLYKAAEENYGDARKWYEYRGLSYVPLNENTYLNSLGEAISAETVGTYENLSNTTGFIMWANGQREAMPIRNAYT